MKYFLPLMILITWQLIQGLEWIVLKKVTDYGQNLTLFCNVSNCCPEYAGWDRWTPVQRTLYIDVKTGRPSKKYDGRALKDGYTLIIQNLTKQDLNVSYSCLYGVTLGERKYLLEEDVFMYIYTTEPNLPAVTSLSHGGEIVGSIVGVAVTAVIFIICFWKQRQKRQRHGIRNSDVKYYQDELPGTIENMPLIEIQRENGIDKTENCKDAIKSGNEIRQYVRIHVIGKDRVGKTSLVRRLLHLKDGKYNGESTDGIEIDKQCQIRKSDGEWIVGEVETEHNERMRRILRTVNKKQNQKEIVSDPSLSLSFTSELETKTQYTHEQSPSKEYLSETKKNQNYNKPIQSTEGNIGVDTFEDENISNRENMDRPYTYYLDNLEQTPDEFVSSPNDRDPVVVADLITDVLIEKMNEIILDSKKKQELMKSEGLVQCGIWDFAGQKDYYATHQTFFTPHAIYILVTDLNEDIKAIKHDKGLDFNSIGDYIDFWFDSIHCFCKDRSASKLCPPLIMVCTGTDKFAEVNKIKEEYEQKFLETFGTHKKIDHNRGIYFISNTNFQEEDIKVIKEIKDKISTIAKDMHFFAKECPTTWIHLEHALGMLRDSNINVYSWDNMVKLAKEKLMEKEELIPFLNYQHKIGNVIFFTELGKYIILKPFWLVKCFRCLVCDRKKIDFNLISMTDWNQFKGTGELTTNLIKNLFQKEPEFEFGEPLAHLLNVMEKFDIIVKPQFIDTSNNKSQKSASYYMPCMIENASSYKEIKDNFIKTVSDVKITPWLVLEFEFLPLAYFNHILFYYIRNYDVCTVHKKESTHKAIYSGKAVFSLDRFRKFIICFSHNAISLQIWEWGGVEDDIYRTVLEKLCDSIENIKENLSQNISYRIKAKCSFGDYFKSIGRISCKDITKTKIYMCEEHSCTHSNEDIENTWLKHAEHREDHVQSVLGNNRESVTDTSDDPDLKPFVDSFQEAYTKIQEKDNYHDPQLDERTSDVELVFIRSFVVQKGKDAFFTSCAVWSDDSYILIDRNNTLLITYNHRTGDVQTVNMRYEPFSMAIIDNNNVAISFPERQEIDIYSVSTSNTFAFREFIKVDGKCFTLTKKDDKTLLVYIEEKGIHSFNMSKKEFKSLDIKIPSFIPHSDEICANKNRLFHTSRSTSSVFCYDMNGSMLWNIEGVLKRPTALTCDTFGNVYVTDYTSHHLYFISADGLLQKTLLSRKDKLLYPTFVYYCMKRKCLLIVNRDNGYAACYSVNYKQ